MTLCPPPTESCTATTPADTLQTDDSLLILPTYQSVTFVKIQHLEHALQLLVSPQIIDGSNYCSALRARGAAYGRQPYNSDLGNHSEQHGQLVNCHCASCNFFCCNHVIRCHPCGSAFGRLQAPLYLGAHAG